MNKNDMELNLQSLEETYGVQRDTEELMRFYINQYLLEQEEQAVNRITNYIKQ